MNTDFEKEAREFASRLREVEYIGEGVPVYSFEQVEAAYIKGRQMSANGLQLLINELGKHKAASPQQMELFIHYGNQLLTESNMSAREIAGEAATEGVKESMNRINESGHKLQLQIARAETWEAAIKWACSRMAKMGGIEVPEYPDKETYLNSKFPEK